MLCDLIARMAFAPTGAEHQYRDVYIRCADRHIHDAAQKERRTEDGISIIFRWTSCPSVINGKPLIEHICIGVEKGEIVTLIGPNGSGKSTISEKHHPAAAAVSADGSALTSTDIQPDVLSESCPRKWRLFSRNACKAGADDLP